MKFHIDIVWSLKMLNFLCFTHQCAGMKFIQAIYRFFLNQVIYHTMGKNVTECSKYSYSFVTLVLCLRFLVSTSAERHEIHVNNIQKFSSCLILKLIHLLDKDHSMLFMEIPAVCSKQYIYNTYATTVL
jgi:hypothetical protein